MKKLIVLLCMTMASLSTASAGEMTLQFLNDTQRALNLKLFVRGDNARELPARTKAYSLRPDSAVQQLKVSCADGENICWGAWMTVTSVTGEVVGNSRTTRTNTLDVGVGERGLRECASCCHVCKAETSTPVVKIGSTALSPSVR